MHYFGPSVGVYAAIVELLLELEGVDPEPDFCWARSSKGPWHIAVPMRTALNNFKRPVRTPNYASRPPNRRCSSSQN